MNTKSVIARSKIDGVEHKYTSVVSASNAGIERGGEGEVRF
ncbi:MAG: hypothetical protein ACK4FV_06570 [Candidatus Nitrosocaldus sp.]